MQQQERPPISRLSLKGFLTFPHRICNPPPSIGKVRSCGVTPFLDVRLDDVLERKHLPPLGLKDFEEYLLYAEQSPENLYFLLWLKEYTSRYNTWAQHTKAALAPSTASHTHQQPFRTPPSSDTNLALFYAKAKQTFFTPGAEYELDVPSDILAPFHYSSQNSAFVARLRGSTPGWNQQNAHPDPAVFTEVALEVRAMLKESLSRFVLAASTNVGSRRAACGIAAGLFFLFVGGVLPLVLTTDHWHGAPHTKWWRLITFPGIWLGLLALISSFNGVCVMVYVFGDLRQLRKFELARPAISKPLPVPAVNNIAMPVPRPPEPTHFSSTSLRSARYSHSIQGSSESLSSECSDTKSSESSEDSSSSIEVSPAYFDDAPAPEGPATATGLHRSRYGPTHSSITFPPMLHTLNPVVSPAPLQHRLSSENVRNSAAVEPHNGGDSDCFGPSAAFIHHEVDLDTEQKGQSENERFDFDLLPKSGGVRAIRADSIRLASNITSSVVITGVGHTPVKTEKTSLSISPLTSAIARQQYKCKRAYPPPLTLGSQVSSLHFPDACTPSPTSTHPSPRSPRSPLSFMIPSFTAGVPAFHAPMTRVHSPVVIRAQWEVVVRSGILALIAAVTIVAIFVGVVP